VHLVVKRIGKILKKKKSVSQTKETYIKYINERVPLNVRQKNQNS